MNEFVKNIAGLCLGLFMVGCAATATVGSSEQVAPPPAPTPVIIKVRDAAAEQRAYEQGQAIGSSSAVNVALLVGVGIVSVAIFGFVKLRAAGPAQIQAPPALHIGQFYQTNIYMEPGATPDDAIRAIMGQLHVDRPTAQAMLTTGNIQQLNPPTTR